MRLIDADELMKAYARFVAPSNNSDFENEPTWNDAVSLLESASTVDAIEVVRCKDCKYWRNDVCQNDSHGYCPISENDFCSRGERRENERTVAYYGDNKLIETVVIDERNDDGKTN